MVGRNSLCTHKMVMKDAFDKTIKCLWKKRPLVLVHIPSEPMCMSAEQFRGRNQLEKDCFIRKSVKNKNILLVFQPVSNVTLL